MALDNVTASLVLDVINHDQPLATVKAIALDSKTRYVRATITQDGLDYPVDENATVTLTILRPDNVGVQVTGSVVDVDNSDRTGTIKGVYAELTQAALAKSGTLRAQFKMTLGEQILRTEVFKINNGVALDAETDTWTDYSGRNLDELVRTVESLEETVTEMQRKYEEVFTADVEESVKNWLDANPEATTTVQDESLTEAKFSDALKAKTIKEYVTPEMYGAKGDGTTDDLTAFQSAFGSGKKVLIGDKSYSLSDYVFADESQIVYDRGTYPTKPLIVSKTIIPSAMSIADRKSITLAELGTRWGSGVAYNTRTGKLLCCGYDNDAAALVDFATLAVERKVTITGLAHGNDATYNPHTDKFYVTPMVNNGEIMVLNTDLTLNSTIVISGMYFAPSQISYDTDKRIYYVGNSQYTYAVNENFAIVKLLSTHANSEMFANAYENINAPYSQGSTVYKGQFMSGVWLGATQTGVYRGRSYGRLATIDYNTGAVKDFYDFPLKIAQEEFETVEAIEGRLCLFSCRFGTLFLTTVNADHTYLAHDTTKFPNYVNATRVENDYCTQTDIGRIRTFMTGNIGIIRFNLLLSTTMPANTRDVKIANLGTHIYDETSVIVAAQNNSGNLLVNIKTGGDIYLTNVNNVALSGFFRTVIPVILT